MCYGHEYEQINEDEPIFQAEQLERVPSVIYQQPAELDIPATPPQSRRQRSKSRHRPNDPGIAVLFPIPSLGGEDSVLIRAQHEVTSPSATESSSACTDSMEPAPLEETAQSDSIPTATEAEQVTNSGAGQDSANVALVVRAVEASKIVAASEVELPGNVTKPPPKTRVDSTQEPAQLQVEDSTQRRVNVRSPLKVQTTPALQKAQSAPQPSRDDTIAASPTLSKHVVPVAEGKLNTLPVVQPVSPTQGRDEAGSPQQLPSFRQLTGDLNALAEAATQEPRSQTHAHRHSQSFGSTTAPSPRLAYHPAYPGSSQTSPVSQYAYSAARSPTSTISEMTHPPYGSPTQYASSAAYFAARRRSSVATEAPAPYPHLPASLPSASSSGESHGHASSTSEGYSTSHTTPIDQPSDGTPRPMPSHVPILPPPPGMPQSAIVINSGFVCDQPGCTAAPFQTQYLLSSHKNVHSSSRPHYCPVKDCPRSEGGRGFKRKNEMIRHGLVHNSPGYICPFCPDREHRYPRPDNLQRHVRVHHVDKDRDDAALREVLAQRLEGAGKQRRRRTNAHGVAI